MSAIWRWRVELLSKSRTGLAISTAKAKFCRATATADRSTRLPAGLIFGSGLGIVVLRRLEDAVRDGDFIHAVIRGTGHQQ